MNAAIHGTVWAMIVMLAGCATGNVAARRGPFAFHYGPSLSSDAIAWYSQFDVLVTHDPLPREQVDRLHSAGTRLVLYEWSVAFYESRATEWQRSLLADTTRLLNGTALTGGAGAAASPAWYFDPMSPDHATGRVADLSRTLSRTGYDGIFFDTTTVDSVHPQARKEYEKRHPEVSYDAAFSRFLRALRQALPAGIIFTNQGYRRAEHYLPHVDFDLTESLMLRPHEESWRMRPWNDPADPWNSISFVMRTMIEPVAARYPHVRFAHLNYIDKADSESIRLVVAVGQLFGGEGFLKAPETAAEIDSIYFRDPGKPLFDRVDHEGGVASHRFFDHGLVAVTAASRSITIDNPDRQSFRNRFTGEVVCGGTITIPASPDVPRAYFFDEAPRCRQSK